MKITNVENLRRVLYEYFLWLTKIKHILKWFHYSLDQTTPWIDSSCKTDVKLCRFTFILTGDSQHRFLNKGIFAKYNNFSLEECYEKCRNISTCESFNMSRAQKECHLSKARKVDVNAELFIYKNGFMYYERV